MIMCDISEKLKNVATHCRKQPDDMIKIAQKGAKDRSICDQRFRNTIYCIIIFAIYVKRNHKSRSVDK